MVKLLIIDDEPKTRNGLYNVLSGSGLPVQIIGTAENGLEGLNMAQTLLPDIIITDIRMPALDGISLTEKLKNLQPDCQIIFISGYSDKDYLKSAISLKAVSYIEKPVDFDELNQALCNAIQNVEEIHQTKNRLSELLTLELISASQTRTHLPKLDLLYPGFKSESPFCTVICQLRYKTESPCNTFAVQKFQMMINSLSTPVLFASKSSDIFILISSQKYLPLLYSSIKQEFLNDAEYFISAGTPVSNLDSIYTSYFNAVICLKKLFFIGYNHICHYNTQDDNCFTSYNPGQHFFSQYEDVLRKEDHKQALAIAVKLFHDVKCSSFQYDSNSIKNVYHQLLLLLSTICRERGLSRVFSPDDFIWEAISEKDTLQDLQDYLKRKLDLYRQETAIKSEVNPLVHRIQKYVESHYTEPELSIIQMAEEFHFTPAYLCQVFKRETHNTINAYINDLRIRKAKELLQLRNQNVTEIAFHVGYRDSNYFSKQFKKHVGMVPSDYREKYLT